MLSKSVTTAFIIFLFTGSISASEIIGIESDSLNDGVYIVLFDSYQVKMKAKQDGLSDIDIPLAAAFYLEQLVTESNSELIYNFNYPPYGGIIRNDVENELSSVQDNPLIDTILADFVSDNPGSNTVVQFNAPAHLDRVDQWYLPLDFRYQYDYDGTGVNVYVMDSGLKSQHTEFSGLNVQRYDFVYKVLPGLPGPELFDAGDHGTHVSGIVGGATFGVAKNINLFSYKIRGNSSVQPLSLGEKYTTPAVIVSALDHLITNHQKPAVVNVSQDLTVIPLPGDGGGSGGIDPSQYIELINDKFEQLIGMGVTVVASAGNDSSVVCATPADIEGVISVGAITDSDTKFAYSNHGNCVDIFAPGVTVESALARHSDNSATTFMSGTSQASPIVTGAVALYLQQNTNASPSQVKNALISNATTGEIESLPANTPNRIINVTKLLDPEATFLQPDQFEDDDTMAAAKIHQNILFGGDRNFVDDNADWVKFNIEAVPEGFIGPIVRRVSLLNKSEIESTICYELYQESNYDSNQCILMEANASHIIYLVSSNWSENSYNFLKFYQLNSNPEITYKLWYQASP
jgi:serine protease